MKVQAMYIIVWMARSALADEYRADCENKGQTQSFSGVGAQHQNARAELAIQTIMYMARTFMIHSSLHWS